MTELSKNIGSQPTEASLIEFLFTIGNLKIIPRTGWTRYPIPRPESVADHSFRLVTMAMLLAPSFGVDPDKATKMAILHDLGESLIGDVVTDGGRVDLPNLPQKLLDEREALRTILEPIGAGHYIDLFDEFMANETPEAQFINQLDKLEMAVQAREYELAHGVELEEFYVSAEHRIHNPILKRILSGLRQFDNQ